MRIHGVRDLCHAERGAYSLLGLGHNIIQTRLWWRLNLPLFFAKSYDLLLGMSVIFNGIRLAVYSDVLD